MAKESINFEKSLEDLEKIVKDLESGEVPLDKAIEKFNEGMKHAAECNKILDEATKTVTKVLNKDGSFEDFEISSTEE